MAKLTALLLALSATACTIEFIDNDDPVGPGLPDGGNVPGTDAQQGSLDAAFGLCGDGFLNAGAEVCDDGNNISGDGCSADCQSGEGCGNGILDAGEVCDDGNQIDDDACKNDCSGGSGCGNAVVESPEQCDAGPVNTPNCDFDCTFVLCGDNVVNTPAGEQCEPGMPGADIQACDSDCTIPVCGDGHVNPAFNEQCDDGNNLNGDGCSASCQLESMSTCGNGVVTPPEQCDNGQPGINTATCDHDCTLAACGDALVNFPAGEQCDTGGASASCDVDCTATVCGDGLVNIVAGEQCDDGNTNNNDSCRNNCTIP